MTHKRNDQTGMESFSKMNKTFKGDTKTNLKIKVYNQNALPTPVQGSETKDKRQQKPMKNVCCV